MSDLLSELGRPENSEEFEDAWASKFSPAEADTETEEATTPQEDTVEEPEGQPRDEHGRFTRVDTPTVDEHAREDELEAEEQGTQAPPVADEVEAYLQKYGGDVREALKAAANAQKLIGSKESERSQALTEAQELRSRLEQLEQRQQQPQQPVRTLTEADVERLDELAVTGNGQQALREAAALDPTGQLAKRVYDTWASVEPGQAALFAASQIVDQRMAQMEEKLAPVQEANARSASEQQFVQSWEAVKASRPELEQLAPGMKAIIDERGQGFARLISEADPETQVGLLETLADAAKSRQDPVVQEQIAQFEAERAEQSRAAKTAAKVVAPAAVGSVPGGAAEAEKTPAQIEAERIRAGIIEGADTSISSGWTTE